MSCQSQRCGFFVHASKPFCRACEISCLCPDFFNINSHNSPFSKQSSFQTNCVDRLYFPPPSLLLHHYLLLLPVPFPPRSYKVYHTWWSSSPHERQSRRPPLLRQLTHCRRDASNFTAVLSSNHEFQDSGNSWLEDSTAVKVTRGLRTMSSNPLYPGPLHVDVTTDIKTFAPGHR